MTMTIKQLVEEMTDQRIQKNIATWRMLQHSLYVRVLRNKSTTPSTTKLPVIVITNRAF